METFIILIAVVALLFSAFSLLSVARIKKVKPIVHNEEEHLEFLQSLKDASLDDEMYNVLKDLVEIAGHITIKDLFWRSKNQYDPLVLAAIRKSKSLGFLKLDNKKCCVDDGDPLTSDSCSTTTQSSYCQLRPSGVRGIKQCNGLSDDC